MIGMRGQRAEVQCRADKRPGQGVGLQRGKFGGKGKLASAYVDARVDETEKIAGLGVKATVCEAL